VIAAAVTAAAAAITSTIHYNNWCSLTAINRKQFSTPSLSSFYGAIHRLNHQKLPGNPDGQS